MAKYKGPFVYPTVDIAVFDTIKTKVLLCRKPNRRLFQFIGGFAEVKSWCYELDAIRETWEEANILITPPIYVGSAIVDDERYRGKKDKIKTILFRAIHISGIPKAKDDVAEVKWFKLNELKPSDIVKKHRPLLKMMLAYEVGA